MTSRFSYSSLTGAVSAALRREGVPAAIADVEAGLMVDADLHGVPSHGVVMLPKLIAGIRKGRAVANPDVRLVRDAGATCVLDGGSGPGRYVSAIAMDRAVEKARAFGLGACLATNTTHWGRAHAYASRAAAAGVIGVCATNAIPTMALPGGLKAILGNNPLAIAIPRRAPREPLVLDIAMTQAALGKVATHRREGHAIPAGWGLDSAGRASEDPAAILASGLLLPMGGHKGVGLALMMELLTAALAGGAFGHEIARAEASGLDPGSSKLFVAVRVESFTERTAFEARVEDMIEHLQSTDPEHPVLLPGERGSNARREYERDGIPVHPDILEQLKTVGVLLPHE